MRGWIANWKGRRRLKRLQHEYFASLRPETEVIPEYVSTLADLRQKNEERARALGKWILFGRNLHLGSGGHNFAGWLNVDLVFDSGLAVCLDATSGLPFKNQTVRRIFSEDFFEHIEHADALEVLKECRRLLSEDGAIRIGVPDLESIVKRVYLRRSEADLAWCRSKFGDQTSCEALNRLMRMDGDHRFLYDWECLSKLLRAAGFRPRRKAFHSTDFVEFQFMDLRGHGLSLFVEAVPVSSLE